MKTRKLDIGDKLAEELKPEEQVAPWPEHWTGVWQMDRYLRSDGLQIEGDILLYDYTFEDIDQRFPLGTGKNKLLVMSCTDYQECDIVVLDSRLPIKKEVKMGSKRGCYVVLSN